MTTVAASLVTMEIAADSMVSGEDSWYMVEKIRRGKTSVYGGAGDWDKLLKFYAAIEAGSELDSDIDVSVLELRHDGIWVYESTIIPARIKNQFWAVGTGANFAIAAMELGLPPAKAVAVACKYDACSRQPIDVLKLEASGGNKKTRQRNTTRSS